MATSATTHSNLVMYTCVQEREAFFCTLLPSFVLFFSFYADAGNNRRVEFSLELYRFWRQYLSGSCGKRLKHLASFTQTWHFSIIEIQYTSSITNIDHGKTVKFDTPNMHHQLSMNIHKERHMNVTKSCLYQNTWLLHVLR